MSSSAITEDRVLTCSMWVKQSLTQEQMRGYRALIQQIAEHPDYAFADAELGDLTAEEKLQAIDKALERHK